MRTFILSGFVLMLLTGPRVFPAFEFAAQAASTVVSTNRWHLRSGGEAEWEHFEGKLPHADRLEVRFQAEPVDHESTLFIRQEDVKLDWGIELNGRKLGTLHLLEADLVHAVAVPAGVLKTGENLLAITPPKGSEDIVIREITVESHPIHEAIRQAVLDIEVVDADGRESVPSRITVTDMDGTLVPLIALPGQRLGVRPGVAYTPDGRTRLGVRAGEYLIYASRGFEFSVSTQRVAIALGGTNKLQFQLHREVMTDGFVACDTHVHTFTLSRHGDATLEERLITLAAEGIELPVAAEHNQHADYGEMTRQLGLDHYFTPVPGNEVTTRRGHFNVFPVRPDSRVPDFRIEHWPALMAALRNTPDTKVIVLNHPRDVHSGFRPFAETNYNRVTGENLRGFEFGFDAVELINSGALRSDLMQVYRDWFGLLNYGYRVVGVGGSDSHDVSRFIVGQGRTYIACPDKDPGRIDIGEACRNLAQGRASVSMGLYAEILVNGRFGPGDLVTSVGDGPNVEVVVRGPAWVSADTVELYANGELVRRETLSQSPSAKGESAPPGGEKARFTWKLERPRHDVHLVAIATGPGVTAPFWAIPRPYQPSSRVWAPRVIGSTNPVWVDADGSGAFEPARVYAKRLFEKCGGRIPELIKSLGNYDQAVAAQAASICHAAGENVEAEKFREYVAEGTIVTRKGFEAYRGALRDARAE